MAPYYIVEGKMREVTKPELPDWEVGGGPIIPDRPSREEVLDLIREKLEGVELPPREDWPPLPPLPPDWRDMLKDYLGQPVQPLPPDPEVEPPAVWPPTLPDLPDLTGKSLVLVRVYVSRKVNFLRWVVVDHDELKAKVEDFKKKIKDRLPAGGLGGTPPQRPTPSR